MAIHSIVWIIAPVLTITQCKEADENTRIHNQQLAQHQAHVVQGMPIQAESRILQHVQPEVIIPRQPELMQIGVLSFIFLFAWWITMMIYYFYFNVSKCQLSSTFTSTYLSLSKNH